MTDNVNNATASSLGPFAGTRSAVNRRQGDDADDNADEIDAAIAPDNAAYSAAVAALAAATAGTQAFNDAAAALVAATGATGASGPVASPASAADDSAAPSVATSAAAAPPAPSDNSTPANRPAVLPARADRHRAEHDSDTRLSRLEEVVQQNASRQQEHMDLLMAKLSSLRTSLPAAAPAVGRPPAAPPSPARSRAAVFTDGTRASPITVDDGYRPTSPADLLDALFDYGERASPSVVPGNLPEEASTDEELADRVEEALSGATGMLLSLPRPLLLSLPTHMQRLRYSPPPAKGADTLASWASPAPSRRVPRSSPVSADAAPTIFNAKSLVQFYERVPRWQHGMWHGQVNNAPIIGARQAIAAGRAIATFLVTVNRMAATRPFSEVAAWLAFVNGVWMRTHLLLCNEIPGLWPYLVAALGSAVPPGKPPPAYNSAFRRAGGEPSTPARDVEADTPPRDARYTCYTCRTQGWTARCCPVCNPTRPGASAWLDAFRNGTQSDAIVTTARVQRASRAAASATVTAAAAATPVTLDDDRKQPAKPKGKR